MLLAVAVLVTSCVDKSYDLVNKEITTDVKIEGNTIAVPFGSLKAVVLDSLIDVNEIEMLEKNANGVYCITMDSTFSVEESVEPITLDIDPIEYNASVEFDKASIETIHINAANVTPAKFSSPEISVEDLSEKLPHLESNVKTGFDIPELENMLAQLANSPSGTATYRFDAPLEVTTSEQQVPCSVDYILHRDIETIRSIRLGTGNDTKGTLVNVVVTNPKVLQDCDKEICFRIDFPEIFNLAKNDAAEQAEKYEIINNGHSVSLDGFVPQGENSSLSFYITDVKDVDKYVKDGRIRIDESIKYAVDYKVDGELELNKDMKVEDFAFDVALDVQLAFLDVAGKTKDVKVDFEPVEMVFSGDFGNLEHIDTINYVEFDEEKSLIKFETSMDNGWLDAFELKEGYALKVAFPDQLDICPVHSEYEGKDKEIVYNEDEHAFYVTDFGVLVNTHWNIAPQRLTLNLPVVNDSCHMDVKAVISCVNLQSPGESGYFYLAGREMDKMVEALSKLNSGTKEAHFRMLESDLTIKDAVVHTEVISSSLNTETAFDMNEKIPSEIARIERIGFKDDVLITLGLDVTGMEQVDADIELDINVALPSFLQLKSYDKNSGIDIRDGVLSLNTSYNPSSEEPLELKLWCTGIDFMNEEFGYAGLLPKDSIDGNSYISYSSNIVVEGEASIHGTEFHSTVLDNDIFFNVKLEIGEIAVKTFHGIYSAEIEGVDEKIDLDLGEELEFLREDGNSITLADPQLELVLMNPVGIPVDVDLHIWGNDENGEVMAESEIATKVSILPAKYDEKTDSLVPVETRLFLSTDTTRNSKAGYDNIEIPNLANLLKRIPYSINMNVEPVVRTDATHHVDISKPIKLDAAYAVVVPLRFDDLHLCYNDTITDLDSSLGETMDMFSNVSLGVKMDVVNTIPLGLSLSVTPLDVNGNVIDGIEIDGLNVAAGSGSALVGADGAVGADHPSQKFAFSIKSRSGDISALDGLAFSLVAASDHTTGAAALKGEQGIKISNIVFEVSGDIEADLSDMDF